MTPYFAPPTKLLIALLRARRRGVAITFLFSKATDNSVGDLVLRSYLSMFLKRSCQVFFCTDAVNHGKVVVVDEKWATVGSANFDRLSLLYNHELNIVSSNQKFIVDIGEVLDTVKAVSAELSLKEWKNRSFKQKVLEILVRPLRLIA
jgi:cardiolipin synthase